MHRDSARLFSVMLPMCDKQRPIRRIDRLSGPAGVPLSRADPLDCGGADLGGGRELAVRRNLVLCKRRAVDGCLYGQRVAGMDRVAEAEFSEFIYSRWLQVVRCRASVVQVRPGSLA
jgi:hypothetical protein